MFGWSCLTDVTAVTAWSHFQAAVLVAIPPLFLHQPTTDS